MAHVNWNGKSFIGGGGGGGVSKIVSFFFFIVTTIQTSKKILKALIQFFYSNLKGQNSIQILIICQICMHLQISYFIKQFLILFTVR